MFERRTLVDHLLRQRPDNALTVSSLGSPTWDIASTGDNPLHFSFIGTMGQAAPFAIGPCNGPTQQTGGVVCWGRRAFDEPGHPGNDSQSGGRGSGDRVA